MPRCIDIRRAMAVASGRLALPDMSFGSVIAGIGGLRGVVATES
jgi:hypothetical protein